MSRLFIQDSNPTRTVRKLLTLVVFVIGTVVVTDWALGRFMPFITIEPPLILRPENVSGLDALWAFNDQGIKPIVFTGSSQAYTGLSPHIFDDRIKAITGQDVQSVNVSVLGSLVTIERNLLRNLIIPNQPKIIFYSVEMRAFLPASQDENSYLVTDFENQPVGSAISQQSGVERDVSLWLLRHSNWFRYRDNLRDWLTGVRGINQGADFLTAVDDLGFAPFPATFSHNAGNMSQFVPFTVTDMTQQLTTDVGETCKQSGVQCILLNMPLHQLAYNYITPSEEALYRELLKRANLPMWDFNTEACRAILGDTAFFNLNHLNSNGAKMLSQMVADTYANVFFKAATTGSASCATLSS